MMNRRKIILILFIAVIVTTALAAVFTLSRSREKPPDYKITIAASFDPSSAPLFIAYKKGFFLKEGVEAALLMHATGKNALQSLYEGKAQFATIADTVLMFAGMENRNILAIATLSDSNEHHRIVALKKRGISEALDLRGKKIGVTKGTSGEFFLHSFLLFRGIRDKDVTMIDLAPGDMYPALQAGEIDAAATWSPTVRLLTEKLGQDGVVFRDNNYLMTWNMAGTRDVVEDQPELTEKLLKGLLRAQQYIRNHPQEAVAITSELTRLDRDLLSKDWENYNFHVRLGEVLLINLEDQARWALENHYKDRRSIPDFADYIYTKGLNSVDHDAVSLIGKRAP